MSAEEWRPVPGWEGLYDVSNLGRVRSWHLYKGQPVPHLKTPSVTENPRDYPAVKLCRDGLMVSRRLHVLVALAFIGPRPVGTQIRHLDDDRMNNTLSNLLYGTPSENEQDKVRNGRHHYAKRDRCKHGHPFTPENTVPRKSTPTTRDCLTCRRERHERAKQAAGQLREMVGRP